MEEMASNLIGREWKRLKGGFRGRFGPAVAPSSLRSKALSETAHLLVEVVYTEA